MRGLARDSIEPNGAVARAAATSLHPRAPDRGDDDVARRAPALSGALLRGVPGTSLRGLYGRPWLALDALLGPLVDEGALRAVHEEVCLALARVPLLYTGGSHRSMDIMPPSRRAEALVDYGEVLGALDDDAWRTFVSLADDPRVYEGVGRGDVGEERRAPLSRPQMQWLKLRHGVYFPWKAYLELIPNERWSEKADAEGKGFTRLARAHLPRTIALVEALPFDAVGRCNVMGLEAHDHGTVHRDGDPREQRAPDEFIALAPVDEKELFLWDEERRVEHVVRGARGYWFNDFDYHGVRAADRFRYSIRVDGVFTSAFRARLREAYGEPP